MNIDIGVRMAFIDFDGLTQVSDVTLFECDLWSWFVIVACFLDNCTSDYKKELILQRWVYFTDILSWFEHNFFKFIVFSVFYELVFSENTC